MRKSIIKSIMFLMLICSCSLSAEIKVLAFAGSTNQSSVNQKLIEEAASIARNLGAKVTLVNLKDYPLPLYNADDEKNNGMPAKAKELRQLMIQNDVIMIASPEYNASLTALLKNTIDWASRSEEGQGSREAFAGKKFAIMSASPGQSGGARGLIHLRTILEALNGKVIIEQVTIPDAYNAFDAQGHLKNKEDTAKLKQLVAQLLKS